MALATVRATCTSLPHQDPHIKNVTILQVQRDLRPNDGERVFRGGHLFCARPQKPHSTQSSFLWFVALSSVSHGLVMLFHALHDDAHINGKGFKAGKGRGFAALHIVHFIFILHTTTPAPGARDGP
jgi:hypothetical protein